MITRSDLEKILTYDQVSGNFTWLARSAEQLPTADPKDELRNLNRWNACYAGRKAGKLETQGYSAIRIEGKTYKAHRLAWLWMTGEFPDRQIDHIDRNRSNNKWANLRLATQSQNQANTICKATSTTGAKGVYFERSSGRYKVMISAGGSRDKPNRIYLGRFNTIAEATAAYNSAAASVYGEFARVA